VHITAAPITLGLLAVFGYSLLSHLGDCRATNTRGRPPVHALGDTRSVATAVSSDCMTTRLCMANGQTVARSRPSRGGCRASVVSEYVWLVVASCPGCIGCRTWPIGCKTLMAEATYITWYRVGERSCGWRSCGYKQSAVPFTAEEGLSEGPSCSLRWTVLIVCALRVKCDLVYSSSYELNHRPGATAHFHILCLSVTYSLLRLTAAAHYRCSMPGSG
jgi:hypothetical protein